MLLTPEEKKIVRALNRLGKEWPKGLILVHRSSSPWLALVRESDIIDDNLDSAPTLSHTAIRGNSCG